MADGLVMPQSIDRSTGTPAGVLIVEDDFLIADSLAEMVRDVGCVALGPVGSVASALSFLREQTPDAALLDYQLRDGSVVPVAIALAASNVPFALLTGGVADGLPPVLANAPALMKPFMSVDLERMLSAMVRTPQSG